MNQKYDRKTIAGFIFGLCFTLLCITLPSAQAATLASIGATIEGIKTHEGPREGVASGQRVYSQKFLQQSSRYIWCELSLTYQAQGQETEIPIVVQYYSPDGSLFYEFDSTLTIQPDWTASSHGYGVGYTEPGWPSQGKYTIKIFEGTTEIVAGSFSMLTDREAADLLLDWLELQYPAYMSPSGQPTQTNNGAIYRSYTTTNTLCGTYGGHLYFMDALGELYNLGEVALWLSLVEEDSESGLSITFNSTDGGTVMTQGLAQITVPPGAIAKNSDGSPGKALISIEPNIPQDKWPAPLPDGYEAVRKVYLFGPSGFVFASPVQIYLPAGDIESPIGLVVLWYKASESQWVPLPLSDLDSTNKRLGISVFELGYFLIASSPLISSNGESWYYPSDIIMPDRRVGGARLIHEHTGNLILPYGYYYTVTIAAVVYKYPGIGWPNLVEYNVSTGGETTGGPRRLTRMMCIPQGTYSFEISRQKAGTISQPPGPIQTYTSLVTVEVGPFTSAFGWGAEAFTGWTDIAPFPEGTWRDGTPATWPAATVPYGTGDLHITLEWENTSDSLTDLDLHLYGPNSMHVWYEVQQSPDGSIKLDRDWTTGVGHAVENIYSLSPIPSGEYAIKVLNFSGSIPKFFQVRARLPDGTVETFSSTMTQNKQEVTILTFTVAAGGPTTVRGNVVHTVDGSSQPLVSARVILGTGFNVRLSACVILEYKTIVADVRTDDQGRFTVNVPAGNFDVFIWKEGYVPATGETATWNLTNVGLGKSDHIAHSNRMIFHHNDD